VTRILSPELPAPPEPARAAITAAWTLDEAEANPLEHPNCVRAFSPHFPGSA